MTQEMRTKRQELKDLSAAFKLLVKEGTIGSINEGLATFYKEKGHSTLKSYRQWKESGFQVKKGSKALLMWGEPKPVKKDEAAKTPEEKEETFFPLAYVFSNLQVETIQK